MWPEPGSNRRPFTFQANALPTELSGHHVSPGKPGFTHETILYLSPQKERKYAYSLHVQNLQGHTGLRANDGIRLLDRYHPTSATRPHRR